MSGRLADKTAFVTAAGQGIGRATALAFAAAGARVIATDVDEAKVHQIASDSIHTARLDVLHAADIAQAARDAGAIDILFNCAGFVHQGTLLDATEDEWDAGVRSERPLDVPHDAGVPAGHAGARPRRDHQHGLGRQQPERRAEPLHLQRHQGRGDRHDQVGGDWTT